MRNIAVNYMYRDASNYKCYETVIFTNPRGVDISELWGRINKALCGVMLFKDRPIFKPELVGLPTAYLFERPGFRKNEDDHDWHEIVSIEEAIESPENPVERSIDTFIESLIAAHKALAFN